eukprot:3432012-Amphidinium_carterae.1
MEITKTQSLRAEMATELKINQQHITKTQHIPYNKADHPKTDTKPLTDTSGTWNCLLYTSPSPRDRG